VHWLSHLWRGQSLRARITIVATTLFAFAVITGAVLLLVLQRASLIRSLDSQAIKTGQSVASTRMTGVRPTNVVAAAGVQIQVLDQYGAVDPSSGTADRVKPLLTPDELAAAKRGQAINIPPERGNTNQELRVLAVPAGEETVLVASGLAGVENSIRILRDAALIGCPLILLAMGMATYFIVGRALRPVAALRKGAQEINAAGLADQRLPVPDAHDEIYRLAVTLNAMLDRIDAATKRQRTFVGDAAHELRSPLASLRLQLEVAQRVGPAEDWPGMLDEVLFDVDRLEQLVGDLLALARSDEAGGVLRRREPVALDQLVTEVADEYLDARVPVHSSTNAVSVDGDPEALRRVVVNLLDNAVRYASSQVSVDIAVNGNGTAELVVGDDGPGIPEDERERVFDRFYRTHESRSRDTGGTGLGLPIVRDVVRAHGGSVSLGDNHPGLRATVILPVARSDQDRPG
jgi:signal transduction histidine kinase